ncbi:MAG: hypothetical protein GY757_52570 [bacterium]|nr:hypothetical protein [bacterium]
MNNKKNTDIFSVSRHASNPAGLAALLFTLVYGSAGWSTILLCCTIIALFEYLFKFLHNQTPPHTTTLPPPPPKPILTPYHLMLFTPLLLLKYSSVTDFRIRTISCVLLIYIVNIACASLVKPGVAPVKPGVSNALKPVINKIFSKGITIWLTAFLIFALASTVVYLQGVHLSGDEPHYLMITQSITEDGDFDLKNNINEKTYFNYLPIEIRFHGGQYDGKYLSFHLPGLSFLLIPFYWLFKLTGEAIPPALFFRLAASVINAFFALALFYIMRMKFPGKNIAGLWLFFLCIFPLVIHSIHLYPELPAATLMMCAYLLYALPRSPFGNGRFGGNKHLLMGLFLSLIPWFHIKYIPPLAVLTIPIIYDILKPLKPFQINREKIKRLYFFFLFPAISAIILVIYCKALYNTLSPTNIFPRESYWTVPFLLRLKVFFSYFLDQRDGLFIYAPLFFLTFAGFRTPHEKDKKLLLWVAFSYVGFHAFTSVRGAYAPAGRPLIFVSWIFILFILHYYYRYQDYLLTKSAHDGTPVKYPTPPIGNFLFKILAGFAVFIAAWLFYYPFFVYQPVFSHTLERASLLNRFFGSDYIHMWNYYPSFLTSPKTGHPANFIWIGILLLLLLIYYIKPLKHSQKNRISPQNLAAGKGKGTYKQITALLLFAASFYLYCYYPHVHLINKNKFKSKTLSFYNNSRNFRYLPDKKSFRIKAGNNYDIFIDRKRKLKKKLTFQFTLTDTMDVDVRNGKQLLFESTKNKTSSFTVDISTLDSLTVGNKQVSHIGFHTRSAVKNAFLWLELK